MSIASLTKFTVPLASDQSPIAQGALMPKLKWRFRVTLENFGVTVSTNELTKQVLDFKRPSGQHDQIEVPIYNSTVYLAGKWKWGETTLMVRDDALGNVSKLVGEQLQKQMDFNEQSTASSGIDYKFVTRLEMLDGGNGANEPVILETWEFYGCYLQSVDYQDVNYGTSEVMQISLTIKFDNALQTPLGTGVGAPVPRTLGQLATG